MQFIHAQVYEVIFSPRTEQRAEAVVCELACDTCIELYLFRHLQTQEAAAKVHKMAAVIILERSRRERERLEAFELLHNTGVDSFSRSACRAVENRDDTAPVDRVFEQHLLDSGVIGPVLHIVVVGGVICHSVVPGREVALGEQELIREHLRYLVDDL